MKYRDYARSVSTSACARSTGSCLRTDDACRPDSGWRELREMQRERAAPLMLWEAEPMPSTREQLAREFGISSIVFSPCANTPDVDDYMSVMRANAQRLSAIAD